ncbi:MAG: hypothetical protein AAGF11_23555 [Myxococcota bacterium]
MADPATGAEPTPTDARPDEGVEPESAVGVAVVLVDREQPGTLLARSESSIRAHLAARSVEVRTEPRDGSGPSVTAARDALDRTGALVAFWARATDDGRVVLYMVRADDDRTYRRQLPPLRPEQLADQDAIALIMQAVVVAVLAGDAPGMEVEVVQTETRPETERDEGGGGETVEPTPPPSDPPPSRGRARVAVAYAGGTFAPGSRWQHGAGLQAGWVFPVGLHLSAGYTWRPPWTAQRDYGRVELQRHPAFAAVGWHLGVGQRLHLDAEIPLILEWGVRQSRNAEGAQGTPRQVSTSLGLGLRGRFAVILAWRLAAFVGLGAEIWPRRVVIAADIPEREVLLDPDLVRFDLRLGLEVRL